MDTLVTCIWLALGGAVGTVARYGLSVWAMPMSQHLPCGPLLINILGSLLIGFFGTLTLARHASRNSTLKKRRSRAETATPPPFWRSPRPS